jgi:hypothetical protein
MSVEEPEPLDGLAQKFTQLPHAEVPAPLEGRVLRSLINAGVLRGAPRRTWPRLIALGATLVLFCAGFGFGAYVGRPRETTATTHEPRYLLLLYTGAAPQVEDVAAHRRWASDLAAHGHTIYGERLDAHAMGIDPGGAAAASAADTLLAGFFVVSANSASVAQRIAASSPHARHGGRVVIYRIRPT